MLPLPSRSLDSTQYYVQVDLYFVDFDDLSKTFNFIC